MKHSKSIASLILLSICVLLSSCHDINSPEVREQNAKTLSYSPTFIGKLPDGRTVVRYTISNGDGRSPHFVYVVNPTGETSVNYNSNGGKSSYEETIVTINGVEYIPKK